MEVNITPPKSITIVAERKKTIDKVTIVEITDNPTLKTVVVTTKEVGRIVLWKNAEYDAIGQWTDSDVQLKLKDLYK
jgi:hypothetical protein